MDETTVGERVLFCSPRQHDSIYNVGFRCARLGLIGRALAMRGWVTGTCLLRMDKTMPKHITTKFVLRHGAQRATGIMAPHSWAHRSGHLRRGQAIEAYGANFVLQARCSMYNMGSGTPVLGSSVRPPLTLCAASE